MTSPWREAWWSTTRVRSRLLWRGVETQHLTATLRLTTSAADHRLLEELLEHNKPPLPPTARTRHYLIATPFRYRSPVASRFRRAHEPGIWYGAEELNTACAEVAYWRWRFLIDSEGLSALALLTTHTFFRAQVRGRCLDLPRAPWIVSAARWRNPRDYSDCHVLAAAARDHAIASIRYASARVLKGVCGAVLDPGALTFSPSTPMQTWVCRTARGGARLQRSTGIGERFEFDADFWK